MSPPITPNESHGAPSFITIAGMSVWNGRLPGAIWLGCPGVEREQVAAIVQHDAGVAGDDAGAEGFVERLDERDDVALRVGGGQVDRVAASPADARRRPASTGRRASAACSRPRPCRRIDFLAPLGGVVLRQHPLDRLRRRRRGVADPGAAIGERDPLGLDHAGAGRRRCCGRAPSGRSPRGC